MKLVNFTFERQHVHDIQMKGKNVLIETTGLNNYLFHNNRMIENNL